MKNSKFAKRVSLNVFLRFFAAVLNLSLHIMLARYLSQSDYGRYVFFVAILFIASQLCSLGFDSAGLKLYQQYRVQEEHGLARGFFLTVLAVILGVSVVLSAALAGGYHLLYEGRGGDVFFLILLFLLASGIQKNLQFLLNAHKKLYVYSLPDLLFKPIMLIVLFLICRYILSEDIDVYYLIYLQCFSLLISSGLGLLFAINILDPSYACRICFNLKTWFRMALPFLGNLSISMIYSRFDIVMLGVLAGDTYVAVYSVANRVYEILHYVFVTFGSIASPVFSETYHKHQLAKLNKCFSQYSRLLRMSILTLGMFIVIGSNHIMLLFGNTYADDSYLLIVFVVTLIIASLFGLSNSLLAMTGEQGYLFKINLLGLLANIILNLALIPYFNIYGAALATMISMNFSLFLCHKQAKRILAHCLD